MDEVDDAVPVAVDLDAPTGREMVNTLVPMRGL
jgi:hypothetical protein